jgi:hypothetical protein
MGIRAWWCGGIAAASLTCATATAEPRREGFTGDLGLGFALTSIPDRSYAVSGGPNAAFAGPSGENRALKVGFAPLSLSLGGFINEDVAEVIPGFYENDSVQGYALVAAWKWY